VNLIAGIDEAGRGCLIGPMAVCGVCFQKDGEKEIQKIGVKDSKQLSPKKRDYLAALIYEIAHSVHVVLVSPQEIDQENLNTLTMKKSVEIINKLTPDSIYLDVPSSGKGIQKYCRTIQGMVHQKQLRIYGENKADQNYPVVSAASVIAKVTRDREIHKLHKIYGNFGSGYPSDPKTKIFAQQCLFESKALPPIIRTKWATITRLQSPGQLMAMKDK
jgi:ribonuclease HII